jgi:acetyltransferase-like isoleucine patch superfamily enzyme
MITDAYGPVTVGSGTLMGEYCVLGFPKEARLRLLANAAGQSEPGSPIVIGENCLIFNHVVVYEGTWIGDGTVIEDRVRIGYDCRVGRQARLLYGAYVCDRVVIGAAARIAGFACDGAVVGDRSTMMGALLHEYSRPHEDWWAVDEEPPVIEADTVVGFGAQVIGAVRVGPCSYVAAGAVVTKDVPPGHVVTGVNVLTAAQKWSGRRLRDLIQHWRAR